MSLALRKAVPMGWIGGRYDVESHRSSGVQALPEVSKVPGNPVTVRIDISTLESAGKTRTRNRRARRLQDGKVEVQPLADL